MDGPESRNLRRLARGLAVRITECEHQIDILIRRLTILTSELRRDLDNLARAVHARRDQQRLVAGIWLETRGLVLHLYSHWQLQIPEYVPVSRSAFEADEAD